MKKNLLFLFLLFQFVLNINFISFSAENSKYCLSPKTGTISEEMDIVPLDEVEFPPFFDWQIWQQCMLRCPHCYANANYDKYGGYSADPRLTQYNKNMLSTEEAKRIVDVLHKRGIKTFAITGGEPLLRPDIYEICSYIHSKGMKIIFNTNGLLIRDDPKGGYTMNVPKTQHPVVSLDEKDYNKIPMRDMIRNFGQVNFSFDTAHSGEFRGDFPERMPAIVKEMKQIAISEGRDIDIQITPVISKLNINKVESELLPVIINLSLDILRETLDKSTWTPRCGLPLMKLNIFRPQKAFTERHNLGLAVTYDEFLIVVEKITNGLNKAIFDELEKYGMPAEKLDELKEFYGTKLNKHSPDPDYYSLLMMPNGVLTTLVADRSVTINGLPVMETVPVGYMDPKKPWCFRKTMTRIARRVTSKFASYVGAMFEDVTQVLPPLVKKFETQSYVFSDFTDTIALNKFSPGKDSPPFQKILAEIVASDMPVSNKEEQEAKAQFLRDCDNAFKSLSTDANKHMPFVDQNLFWLKPFTGKLNKMHLKRFAEEYLVLNNNFAEFANNLRNQMGLQKIRITIGSPMIRQIISYFLEKEEVRKAFGETIVITPYDVEGLDPVFDEQGYYKGQLNHMDPLITVGHTAYPRNSLIIGDNRLQTLREANGVFGKQQLANVQTYSPDAAQEAISGFLEYLARTNTFSRTDATALSV